MLILYHSVIVDVVLSNISDLPSQGKAVAYLDTLVELGVTGFSVVGAKALKPEDLAAVESKVKDLPTGGRPLFLADYENIGDVSTHVMDYANVGYVTEYRFGRRVAESISDFTKLGNIAGLADSDHAVVFVDNQVTQRTGDQSTLSFRQPIAHKLATSFTLAYGYGTARVMSSYRFGSVDDGPPSYSNNSIAV